MYMDLLRRFLWLWVLLGMVVASLVIGLVFLLINRCLSRGGKHNISQLHRKPDFKIESNKYQERNPDGTNPPLPPRTQFETAGAQSYENLAEEPDYEDGIGDYEQTSDQQPDYLKVEEESKILSPPPPSYNGPNLTTTFRGPAAQSYENLAEEHDYEDGTADYEQSTDQQPDYVDVEDQALPPPPPLADPSQDPTFGFPEAQSYENLAEEPDYEQTTDQQPDYMDVEDEVKLRPPQAPPPPADPGADTSSSEDYDDIGGEDEDEEDYDDVG